MGPQPAGFFGAIANPDTKSVEEISTELKQDGEPDMQQMWQRERQHKFNSMPWWFRRLIVWAGLRFPKVRLTYMGATFGLSSLGKWGMTGLIPPCVSTS